MKTHNNSIRSNSALKLVGCGAETSLKPQERLYRADFVNAYDLYIQEISMTKKEAECDNFKPRPSYSDKLGEVKNETK